MSLKLMYITNDPAVATIAEEAGVDRIFIDMEFIGKQIRQGGMDTVQSRHTIDDIRNVKKSISTAKIMVRINPIHEAGQENGITFSNSQDEINDAIDAGADILMLPFFKTADEVRSFVTMVDGRVKTFPLLETPEAVECLDEILNIPGIDEIHIGLNDLSLALKKGFMFSLLSDGTVETIAEKCKAKGIPFGFGGIASLGTGMLPAEYIIGEHYRLGSEIVILSRSFCNTQQITDLDEIKRIFNEGIRSIRNLEAELEGKIKSCDNFFFIENKERVSLGVEAVQRLLRLKR